MVTGAPPALGNPRRLGRLVDALAAGVRRPAAIARLLDVETRVIRAYLAHAAWLGLVVEAPEPHLTAAGLAYAYAGTRRAAALASVLKTHPVLGRPPGPTVDELAAVLVDVGVSTSEPLSRRDARAILRLVEPSRRLRPRPDAPEQLQLSFGGAAEARRPLPDPDPGDESLDVYGLVLRALLEEGELRLNTLRGVLDESGAAGSGLGAYAALAVRRGDATRRGEALVVTPGALRRAALAESVVSIALSDPDFRAWLAAPDVPAPEARRAARWGRRLFGAEPAASALPRLLFGRAVASVPLAGAAEGQLEPGRGAFLDRVSESGMALAFPQSLSRLAGGIGWVHQSWRPVVQNPAAVRLPGPLDAHLVVHAGLLAPGEPPPRNIPDVLSLRLRAVRAVPAFALLVAAGLLHRRRALRLRLRGDSLWVERPGRIEILWTSLLERLARRRGWWLCPPASPRTWRRHVETAAALGLLAPLAGAVWTVDEALYFRLGTDPEHHELHDRLTPLADLLEAACDGG